MAEKSSSIQCEQCGGWHPTEAHAQYETKVCEKRVAEIKARPDSAYRFDALGFTPDKKGKIDPWMHEVIEKAKDLGDDLQDADLYIHFGPIEAGVRGKEFPSTLSMITQDSFVEGTYISRHISGESMMRKAHWSSKAPIEILELQERWVRTRSQEDLKSYQQKIQNELNKIIKINEGIITSDPKSHFDYQKDKERANNLIKKATDLLSRLDTAEGRKASVYLIQIAQPGTASGPGGEEVGVIFSVGDAVFEEPSFYFKRDGGEGGLSSRLSFVHATPVAIYYKEKLVIWFGRDYADWRHNPENQTVGSGPNPVSEEAREFYKKFIHALYLPHGSIEEQQRMLERVLDMTKDHPEQRLPIYNFYGKLVWPRPPSLKSGI
ncbi:MAG: hypothetical protein Q7N87_02060 [Candidatus Uhrbacteria bacterium]|nr:hypothetical protein [Candidatus Uhrbacteria bacterium]